MILTVSQMQAAEERLFATGAEAEPLMERAGLGIADAIVERLGFTAAGSLLAFVGPGHNGGDALVAARHLKARGWAVTLRLVGRARFRPLTEKKLAEFGDLPPALPQRPPLVLLDGLLGIGARGPLRGDIAGAAAEMNALRLQQRARTVAIDIPSGLDGDTGEAYAGAVVADLTLTIAHAKAGLLADAGIDHVGRLGLVPLDEIVATDGDRGAVLLEPRHLAERLARRRFDTHKGQAGRVAIVAGSRGLTGAAVLCSAAAVRGGAGLVTLFVPEDIYPIVAAAAIPEVMVRPVENYLEVREVACDVLAIGPGIGSGAPGLLELITSHPQPCVLDADALNLVAGQGVGVLHQCQGSRLLTPHPGEMERLLPRAGRSRRAWAEAFAGRFPELTLLLKGARSLIAGGGGQAVAFNPTGHPGMATGGVGDVLTGLSAALIAQGLSPYDAACAASWLSGRAAELAIDAGVQSERSFCASDVIGHLGRAFRSLESH